MKKGIYILLLLVSQIGFAQNTIEQLREQAYNAKQEGDLQKSIELYSKIFQTNPDDYDAKLALARLYFTEENYQKSTSFYNRIYIDDKTDIEALKGLGDNWLHLDKIDDAVSYYNKALIFLPQHIPTLLQLAKAYSWQGELDKAIKTYQRILAVDDTYAEAYQGIGKMYYWKDQPNTASKYYKKAIALDPSEKPIQKEYQNIKKQTALNIESKSKYVQETEESYKIDALIQQLKLHKRILDHLDLSLTVLADHSVRDYKNTTVGDTTRWYNAAWAKIGWITDKHKFYVYSGYSASDKKLSTYGLNWQWNISYKSFDITNSFTGGYDYFYYWNEVGKMEVNDNVSIKYKKITLNIGGNVGEVDEAFILDVVNDNYVNDKNTFLGYNASLSYQVLASPKINVAVNYSFLDYKYKSNQYYSPLGRNLYGPSLNIYHSLGKFYFYGDFSYNLGDEYYYENTNNLIEKFYLNADNWAANAEFGYDYKMFSASISGGRFYNNYYNNIAASLNLKYAF